jgi:subtilisin family serine protease
VIAPWYTEKLGADRVWREFGVFGQHTITVIHDSNFVMTAGLAAGLYRKPGEIPANGKDDDGNGLADDVHGFNFDHGNANLTPLGDPGGTSDIGEPLHGFLCASIICGPGMGDKPWVPGIAPRGQWAGVIGHGSIEDGVEWAAEIGADTYNMSFSLPGFGQYRTHWRKVLEQGVFCGLVFVSGAGNFAREGSRNFAPVPVQMRVPEDIPDAVISAAGVRQDLTRPPFSSQGPVQWQTDYYREGKVDKPDVATFNANLPVMMPDGVIRSQGVSGNSFAGAMLSGAVALILSADPEILPWDLRDIIFDTAKDINPFGFDYQTGHGLVDCHRAVQEVLKRKSLPAVVQPQ